MSQERPHLCIFGASPGTGNQGVNALCWATLEGVARRAPARITVFSYGAQGAHEIVPGSAPPVCFRMEGMSAGRRVWRTDHLKRARLSAAVGLDSNAIVHSIRTADLVLDLSGGDSFTDLYGGPRFRDITGPKKLAHAIGTPLVLLPQTYGPFTHPRNARTARDLIAGSTLAWARDPDSFRRMRELLDHRYDPQRHLQGVDVAFALQAQKPAVIDPDLQAALDGRHSRPLIGLNISGLLANEANIASERFGLAGDYRVLVGQLLTRLLESSDAHIVLLPHVHAPAGHYESDLQAADAVLTSLPARVNAAARERVTVVRRTYDATVLKWIIAQTEWFCGSRMHSTIAALSSGVPACALAYSLKTRGVFASCGVSESSVDLRELSTSDALEAALRTWKHRRRTAKTLENTIPGVLQQCERQFDQVMGRLTMAWAA